MATAAATVTDHGISLFELLFPKTHAELSEAHPTPAPVTTTPTVATLPAPPMARGSGPGLVLAQGATPGALAAAYLAANAPGLVRVEPSAMVTRIPAQGSATASFQVPSDQEVLILLAPLTVTTRTHSGRLQATITVDTSVPLSGYPLTVDGEVLAAESTLITQGVQVDYVNGDWVDVEATLSWNAVAWNATDYHRTIAALTQGIQQAIATRAASLATTGGTVR